MNGGTAPPTYLMLIAAAWLALSILETALYLGKVDWYFRSWPVVGRQTWQTNVSLAEATSAIESALQRQRLAFSRRDHAAGVTFCVRKSAHKMSMWPRVTLIAAELRPGSTAIEYAARPFLTTVLAIPLGIAAIPFAGPSALLLIAVAVVIGYLLFWLWENRTLNGLEPVRRDLERIGVRICRNCGYDVRMSGAVCPECGKAIPSSQPV